MWIKSIQFLFPAVTKKSNGSAAAHMGKIFSIKRAFVINRNTWSLEKIKRTMCQRIGNLCGWTESICCIVVVVVVTRCHRANSDKSFLSLLYHQLKLILANMSDRLLLVGLFFRMTFSPPLTINSKSVLMISSFPPSNGFQDT